VSGNEAIAQLRHDSSFCHQHDRLLTLLRELAFAEREVTLSSGLKSNFYIDCKQVSLHPEGAHLIGALMHRVIEQVAPTAAAAGGLTLGADPLATAASIASFVAGRPRAAFIVRKEPKGHGTGQWIEMSRVVPAASALVVLEDVVTTGAATLTAIDRVTAAGHRVLHAIAIVDRLEGGRQAVTAHAPLTTLFTRKDFLP
jgi:orotate phosphoribosyltransferase